MFIILKIIFSSKIMNMKCAEHLKNLKFDTILAVAPQIAFEIVLAAFYSSSNYLDLAVLFLAVFWF